MSAAKREIKKITTHVLQEMKARGEKISMLTAYDYSMARIIDGSGIDVILVGDSASNVMAGNETTLPITLDQIIYHATSVVRGVKRSLVVVDIPFGYYQGSSGEGLRSAIRTHWQREIAVATLLSEPFVALAEQLNGQQADVIYPPAPAVSHALRLPATAEQRRLWLMQQRTPTSTAYNVPLILHLAAGVDVSSLARAVEQLVERHPALRTAFVSGADGLDQVIAERGPVCRTFETGHFTEETWRAFAALVFGTPFDLAMPTLFQAEATEG